MTVGWQLAGGLDLFRGVVYPVEQKQQKIVCLS